MVKCNVVHFKTCLDAVTSRTSFIQNLTAYTHRPRRNIDKAFFFFEPGGLISLDYMPVCASPAQRREPDWNSFARV